MARLGERPIHAWVPASVIEAVDRIAERDGLTRSSWIRALLYRAVREDNEANGNNGAS